VRLVDRDERRPQRGEAREQPVVGEPLGGDVHEPIAARGEIPLAPASLVGLERGGEVGRRDAARLETADLIVHERDERRDDDRRALQLRGRKLVRERLAATRGRDHERMKRCIEQRAHGVSLPGPKARQAEARREACIERGIGEGLGGHGARTIAGLVAMRGHRVVGW
jgi:hypothetical protein